MPTAPEKNAADRFVTAFERSLGCVCVHPKLDVAEPTSDNSNWRLWIGNAKVYGNPNIQIGVEHAFSVISHKQYGRKAHTTAYHYRVSAADGRKLLRYEYHPGVGEVRAPHLHVHANIGQIEFEDRHLPTGRVTLEAFVCMLEREFGAKWVGGGQRCLQVLKTNEKGFEAFKTW